MATTDTPPDEALTPTEEAPAEEVPVEETLPVGIGDVDVADVDPGSGKGEVGPVILEGYWVRLGAHASVPDATVGKLAAVVDSPWQPSPIGVPDSGIAGYIFDENKEFVVQLRDETNALLSVPQEAFVKVGQMRVDVEQHG